jgi:thymidylate synthase (FAD)
VKVSLIDYTGIGNPDKWHAARVLLFTKQTRLNVDASRWAALSILRDDEILPELEYMAETIPSSWEFVHYTFAIEGVTRALTHQLVRTRTASFAQQSMRVTDMSGFKYRVPPSFDPEATSLQAQHYHEYAQAMDYISQGYKSLIAMGAAEEDARGVLPTNILTNIVGCYNLRTLSDLVKSREGGRTQDEYREVVRLMGAAVLDVHPWSSVFLYPKGRDYWAELEDAIATSSLAMEKRRQILKIIDKMRKEK